MRHYTFKLERKTMDEYEDEKDSTDNKEENASLAKAHEIEETEQMEKERST